LSLIGELGIEHSIHAILLAVILLATVVEHSDGDGVVWRHPRASHLRPVLSVTITTLAVPSAFLGIFQSQGFFPVLFVGRITNVHLLCSPTAPSTTTSSRLVCLRRTQGTGSRTGLAPFLNHCSLAQGNLQPVCTFH
jgi:hypothetical protein